jgi:uncharacterized protein (TIGR04551 family)
MPRSTAVAALAALLLAAGARAEEPKKDAPLDPRVEALIRQAVEKAKLEMREEVKAELQTAQATAEFAGASAPGPRLQFFELDGYFRVRGDLKDSYDLNRAADNARGFFTAAGGSPGNYVYPGPVLPGNLNGAPNPKSTMTSANMRLRLLPTINVSERVRIRAEADLFDNYVLGSRPLDQYGMSGCGTGATCTFVGHSSATYSGAVIVDRPVVNLKMAWGEVETPVGLLSFGRMPSVWGLGIVAPAQDGLDDDFGNIADRIQFATMPVATVVGSLTFIPYLDFFANGPLQGDPRWSKSTLIGVGAGQPFILDPSGSGRVLGLKVVRLDTADELRRKLERNDWSLNYGLFYEYTTLSTVFKGATDQFPVPTGTSQAYPVTASDAVNRGEYDHQGDLWIRFRTPRFSAEFEGTWLYAKVNNPTLDPGYGTVDSTRPLNGKEVPIQANQFGAALRTSYQASPNRLTLGLELALASGDTAPGFGNRPWMANTDQSKAPYSAVFEGTQYNLATGDHSIDNFRFNPGYTPDLIFWHDIMGQVTDAWYLKPSVRVDIVGGLAWDLWAVFSQSLTRSSTPSTSPETGLGGSTMLGIEGDTRLTLTSDEGFSAWGAAGVFQPLSAFDGAGSLSRAWTLRFGLAARF